MNLSCHWNNSNYIEANPKVALVKWWDVVPPVMMVRLVQGKNLKSSSSSRKYSYIMLNASYDFSGGIKVSKKLLDKASLTFDDWMFIINRCEISVGFTHNFTWHSMYHPRPEVEEKDCVEMLKWFHKTYKGGVTSDQFRCFFPAINTGQHLSDMVFRYIVEE